MIMDIFINVEIDKIRVVFYHFGILRSQKILQREGYTQKPKIKTHSKGLVVPQIRTFEAILSDLTNPKLTTNQIRARLPAPQYRYSAESRVSIGCETSTCDECLKTCDYLKNSKLTAIKVTQYLFLKICSEGCRGNM